MRITAPRAVTPTATAVRLPPAPGAILVTRSAAERIPQAACPRSAILRFRRTPALPCRMTPGLSTTRPATTLRAAAGRNSEETGFRAALGASPGLARIPWPTREAPAAPPCSKRLPPPVWRTPCTSRCSNSGSRPLRQVPPRQVPLLRVHRPRVPSLRIPPLRAPPQPAHRHPHTVCLSHRA